MTVKHRSIRLRIMPDGRGLAAEGFELDGTGRKSADFGIIETHVDD